MDLNKKIVMLFKKYVYPLLAGASLALAFAPVSLVGFGIISLAWFFHQLISTKKLSGAFYLGWLYGFGFFALGTSWIYVSIHTYGRADVFSSVLVTILFCLFMGLYYGLFALSFAVFSRAKSNIWLKNISFSVLWIIFEYLRAHLFTGFPWLLLGFSQTETPMQYLAPLLGVYGLSFLMAFSSGLLTIAWIAAKKNQRRLCMVALLGLLLFYCFPQLLSFIHWTTPIKEPIPVSVIQGNIAENEKWLPHAYEKTITHYVTLTRHLMEKNTIKTSHARIIVWPEGAIPVPYQQAKSFLMQLSSFIAKNKATLVTGIPYQNAHNTEQYYNAMLVLGNNSGHYFKHHIVPFGEYFPAEIFREIMEWLGVSLYETGRGAFDQPLLMINHIPTLPFICYEIAYADILLRSLPKAQLFITISDDAWFGHSMARAQHLQIAQMRSLQSGRYQIVGTNNGISAVINDEGKVIHTIPSFKTRILNSEVIAMSGATPWAKIGDDAILTTLIGLWLLIMFANILGNSFVVKDD